MSFTPLHVVIIGGGIGGLCLAQGLKAAGVSVAVYERNSPTAWLEGYRIHINPVGSRALHACLPPVLWEAFVATAGKPPAGLGFLTEQLQELVVIADEFLSQRTGNPLDAHYPVSRIAWLLQTVPTPRYARTTYHRPIGWRQVLWVSEESSCSLSRPERGSRAS